jgi:hypothetical protein
MDASTAQSTNLYPETKYYTMIVHIFSTTQVRKFRMSQNKDNFAEQRYRANRLHNCYVCQPFKYLNCLRYTKHIATLAEFVLLADT